MTVTVKYLILCLVGGQLNVFYLKICLITCFLRMSSVLKRRLHKLKKKNENFNL